MEEAGPGHEGIPVTTYQRMPLQVLSRSQVTPGVVTSVGYGRYVKVIHTYTYQCLAYSTRFRLKR
jgi:hypothetical protein